MPSDQESYSDWYKDQLAKGRDIHREAEIRLANDAGVQLSEAMIDLVKTRTRLVRILEGLK